MGFDLSRVDALPHLPMSQPGDAQERDADRVAAAVMSNSEFAEPVNCDSRGSGPDSQRSDGGNPAQPAAAAQRISPSLRSSSQPLDRETRRFMEDRFGHDFSQVRVHADSEASQSALSAAAQAYTLGPHIVFGHGQYQPHTPSGRELIAHELAHVVQQPDDRPMVHRKILYSKPPETAKLNLIRRFMQNEPGAAETKLTINGKEKPTNTEVHDALDPKVIEPKNAPAPATPDRGAGTGSGSGGGSGSGSAAGGGGAAMQCGYKDWDVTVSATIKLPQPPKDGQWGGELIDKKDIKRNDLPSDCKSKDQITVVIKGEPDSTTFNDWITKNEREHATDINTASARFLEPYYQAVTGLRGSGADLGACRDDLDRQLVTLIRDGHHVKSFFDKVAGDIACRDVPGGHEFVADPKVRLGCNNLELKLKPKPAPSGQTPRCG